MSLQRQHITSTELSEDEFIALACAKAEELEEHGRYEEAREALSDYWSRIGEAPRTESLSEKAAATLLLRVGALTGWIGSAKQIEGSQETAKTLLHQSIEAFARLYEDVKRLEGLTALAVCYWREGALDNARALLLDVITNGSSAQHKVRSNALLNLAMVERKAGHLRESLEYLKQVEAYVGNSDNLTYKGRLHNARANCYFLIADGERKPEYLDKAILDWTSATYYYEQAGHTSFLASIENNLGYALMNTGAYHKAHFHLSRSRELYASIKDKGFMAQVDDTRARLFIAEGKYLDAERVSRQSVQALESGGEKSVLAESLITHGTALSRLGHTSQAEAVLTRACFIAETSGALQLAGLALVVLLEELVNNEEDTLKLYERADDLLADTDDLALISRLRACSRRIMKSLQSDERPQSEEVELYEGFSLKEATNSFQQKYVIKALQMCGGKIKPAAKLLGVTRQAVQQMLGSRFSNVRFLQTTTAPRQSIIKTTPTIGQDLLIAPDESLSGLGIHAEDVLVIFPKEGYADGEPIVATVAKETYIGYYRFNGERHYIDSDCDDPIELKGGNSDIVGRVVGFIPAREKYKQDSKVRPV